MENKISIITPIYNAEEYLERCIESQIGQTYKNIEIILIDDGSIDNSSKICNKYAEFDDRINVIHKQNEGVSVARNEGIRLATGEWILFVDSDDFLEKDACYKFIKIVEKYKKNIDLIVASSYVIKNNQKETTIAKYNKEALLNSEEKRKMINNIFVNVNEDFSCVGTPWAKLYNVEFLRKHKLEFKPGLQIGEDLNLNFKILYMSNRIVFSPQIVYNYNINQSSINNGFMENMIEQFQLMYQELEENEFITEFRKEYSYFTIRHLRKLEKKYFFHNENINNSKEIKEEYIKLLETYPYNEAIKNAKLSDYHDIKKRIYIVALKAKWYGIIKLWNNKRERN